MSQNKLYRKLRDRTLEREGGEGHGFHSGAYHRFFEDYQEREVVDKKGKTRIERVYVGTWYTRDLTDGQNIRQNVFYALLWLASLALFILCAFQDIPANKTWYVAAFQLVALGGFFWLLCGLARLYTAPKRMTIGDHRASSLRLRHTTFFTAGAAGATGLVSLISALFMMEGGIASLLVVPGYAACALLLILWNRLESNLPYLETPSEHKPHEDGVTIE